jgi:uncharacterized protein (TIGR02757 family)
MVEPSSLERLYEVYNGREWVHPDPLEYLYAYPELRDREVAGLIAASLAYGRVMQILKSVGWVLKRLGPSPHAFLLRTDPVELQSLCAGFVHRFTTESELFDLLEGVRRLLEGYGSIRNCFVMFFKSGDGDMLSALSGLVRTIKAPSGGRWSSLLPCPEKGSACKRLHLFLRWMVREDRVDPGGWSEVPPSQLMVPLDTHMHRIGLTLGLTKRKAGDLRTAMEITDAFRRIRPEDPVRYDFALTRLGIRRGQEEGFAAKLPFPGGGSGSRGERQGEPKP